MYKKIYFILLTVSLLCANEEVGYGWDVPNSSLNIGGYLDVTYDGEREEDLLFNDIAMLFSSNSNRFDLLGEIELSHISLDGKSNSSSDIDLNIERLQLGYTLSDRQSIQIGRFNSDIGYWNQAPIAILQETTTKPHIMEKLFPRATTGILYRYSDEEENSFSMTFQHNKDLAHQDNTVEIDRHLAIAYHGVKDAFSWRLSLGTYRDVTDGSTDYMGIGSEYDGELFSIQTELFQKSAKRWLYSGYIQPTWHFDDTQDAVVRFESYKDELIGIEEQIYLLGYLYRPTNNIALKGEYIHHSQLPLNRFVFSLSVLF
jgi:hypothetical protein